MPVMAEGMRLDDLARVAGVPTTTVRLYQAKGLLPGPRLVGRTGYYDDSHLTRLRLIAKLQDEGFSLAGVRRVLEAWEQGRDIDALVGVERQVEALIGGPRPVVMDAVELMQRFPEGVLTADLVQRATEAGLVDLTDDGRVRVRDPRFLDTGAALAHLGVPVDVILDQWDALTAHTDDIATRFVTIFEQYLLPADWKALGSEEVAELGRTLERLRRLAAEVVSASLDASISRAGRERLGELVPGD